MNSSDWSVVIALVLKEAPQLIAGVTAEIQKSNPTAEDWRAMWTDALTKCDSFIAKEQAALAALSQPAKP